MSVSYNYRHLYYFWVVAKEGSMSKAADRLNMAVQTISVQVHELEKDLGQLLFKPVGRGLGLTEAGQAALKLADQIFSLGEQLPAMVKDAASNTRMKLTIGVSDGLPKLITRTLIESVLSEKNLQLICHEGEFDDLVADLALHRLDLVLADRSAPENKNLNLYSKELGSSPIAWYASPTLAKQSARAFPDCLADLPILLPTHHASSRLPIDAWLDQQRITPNLAGEFEDSALLVTFGSSGMGVFPAAQRLAKELKNNYGLEQIGVSESIREYFFALRTEKKVHHPLIQKILGQTLLQ